MQVSRLGNPLFNEVLVPMAKKDLWNSLTPADDKQFARYVAEPELANLLPVLYPGVFPQLDTLNKSGKPRADLLAILLTGIPGGVVPGFQNFTGTTQADMLLLCAQLFCFIGFHREGVTLIVEHGTAAIPEWLELELCRLSGGEVADDTGAVIRLAPGNSWVELVPLGGSADFVPASA